ncbi:MAG: SDR family NAD(P)-dependent oxidoreductase [Holophagales bacterium]|nr:SDR family NAD(P)-dependent oxidoreductase [Holophagales bacterium]
MSRLANKVVLISGASSGLGEYLARDLVSRGARVGLLARREERLRALAEELQGGASSGEGGGERRAAWAEADVTDGEGLGRALDQLAEELGGVDVIVANAGYGHPEPPHRFQPGDSIRMYDTNVLGMLRMIDWALPRFLEKGDGHIVGVASMASYAGLANSASYCGTKAAMRVHLQGLRVSLAPYGVAVTTICPGFVESELTADNKAPMPFLWKAERATRLMADAIENRRGEVPFPWQMRLILGGLTRLLPTALTETLLRGMGPKPKPITAGETE